MHNNWLNRMIFFLSIKEKNIKVDIPKTVNKFITESQLGGDWVKPQAKLKTNFIEQDHNLLIIVLC